jgi:hypothetical protein
MSNVAHTSLDRALRHLITVSLVIALAAGSALAGATTLPVPAGMQETMPPTRISLWKFFANPAGTFSYKVSPDGRRLAWIQGHAGRLTIFYRTIDEDDIRIIDTHSPRAIFWFTWAQDSRRLLYTQDRNGDENYHVYLADTEQPQQPPVALTPFERTRAWIHQVIRSDSEHVIIAHNQREPTVFDLYRVNLSSHEQTRIAENPQEGRAATNSRLSSCSISRRKRAWAPAERGQCRLRWRSKP